MEDKKKISDEVKEDRVVGKSTSQGAYTQDELADELESLAQTFREELEKAKELPDEEFEVAYADEFGVIAEDDLCECCGERRKDKSRGEGYQYCSVCRENMKKYPLSVPGVLTAIVMIALAVVSIFTFTQNFYGYDLMYKAQKAEKENKLNTALMYYDTAISEMEDGGVNPKNAYLKSARIVFKTMDNGANSMYEVAERIVAGLTEFETNLPIYADYMELREEAVVMYGTLSEFYSLADSEEYQDYDPEDDEKYKSAMSIIGDIKNNDISVLSADGVTVKMVPANEGIVAFCQYMFAYTSERYDDSYEYMLKAKELVPEYYWLYAYELGMVELQNGNPSEAKKLAKQIMAINVEDADAYSLYTSAERISGNLENALNWANKGLSYDEDNAELMRYKAMALCAKGENEEAKKVIDEAIELQEYGLIYYTAIVIENELGNSEKVEEYIDYLKENDTEVSEKLQNYLDGKITALKLFTEGTGEVQ